MAGNNFRLVDPNLVRSSRGLSRAEAAAYVGLSPSGFSTARREGKYPNPTLPGRRYDRRPFDEVMDKLSGVPFKPGESI
jgi:hypothetical protein